MQKILLNFILTFSVIFFTGTVIWSQPLSDEAVKKIEILTAEQFEEIGPGCAILVSKDGEIVYINSYGMSDVENNIPMKVTDLFRIGSITKQFTAVAILKLMEEGKLSLDDEITKYIPDYPVNGQKITIEHLLTHTSGIRSYTNMASFDEDSQTWDVTLEEIIDFFKDQPMDFDAGTKWLYNNSGYILLGYIIEKVSGKNYCQYIEEDIFKPAGMNRSFCGDVPELVNGYKADGSDANPINTFWAHAAGMLVSNVEDLNKWNTALLSGNVISLQTLQPAFTEYLLPDGKRTSYGYGWFTGNLLGTNTIEHGGGINGFVTNAIYIPEDKTYIVVLSNLQGAPANRLSELIAAVVLDKSYDTDKIRTVDFNTDELVGVYSGEDNEKRNIFYEDGELYSQRSGGPRFKLIQFEKDKFMFENSMSIMEVNRNQNGEVVGLTLTQRISPQSYWRKTDEVYEEKTSIELEESSLIRFVGVYELSPSFSIEMTIENGVLYAQPTGQPKLQLHPESERKFFLKEVDAQIEFFVNENGEVDKMMLYQGGMEIEGLKQ